MLPTFLNNLNDVQRQAVTCSDGPVMVLAGAGSGKTRVLTYRVAFLIHSGISPHHILALTFTNKASREMKDRIFQLIGNQKAHAVWMGTFHSVFTRILKIECELIGFPKEFSIYDTDDSKNVLKGIVKDFHLDEKVYSTSYLLHRISSAKMNLLDPEQYMKDPAIVSQDKQARKPLTGQIYKEYRARCVRSSAMDFDDLLYYTNYLFHHHPEVLAKYQQRFAYILVDEYQDTNFAQYLILKKLAANHHNICVVGDDAQSIYAFRGADIQNILSFKKDYPEAQVFKLEQNYRSTQHIVAAANSVIVHNQNQLHKTVWTGNDEGEPVSLIRASNETDEALQVANAIFHSRMTWHLKNSDFAILYRTNAQSRALEDALRKMNIRYRVYGGMSFYKRKEVKDLIAYFRLVINPSDNEAFFRVVNYPARGIGNTTLQKLASIATEREIPVWVVASLSKDFGTGFNSGTIRKLDEFAAMINRFRSKLTGSDAYALAQLIATESGLVRELFEDRTPEGVTRYENIESVLNGIKTFQDEFILQNDGQQPSLSDFIQMISLMTTGDESADDSEDTVSLMTVHAAKGLEFPYVYITGLEENLFPGALSMNSKAELEEERRLFYVAITRAMQKLTLSYADTRLRWGELNFSTPSRFLEEISSKLFDIPRKFSPKPAGYEFKPKSLATQQTKMFAGPEFKKKSISQPQHAVTPAFADHELAKPDEIVEGVSVEHARFGTGQVVRVEGSGLNKKATVEFPGTGMKQLVLKFARLRLIR